MTSEETWEAQAKALPEPLRSVVLGGGYDTATDAELRAEANAEAQRLRRELRKLDEDIGGLRERLLELEGRRREMKVDLCAANEKGSAPVCLECEGTGWANGRQRLCLNPQCPAALEQTRQAAFTNRELYSLVGRLVLDSPAERERFTCPARNPGETLPAYWQRVASAWEGA